MKPNSLRNGLRIVAIGAMLLLVGLHSVLAQHSAFSLTVTFKDALDDSVRSDGAAYVDLEEGRVPSVYSADGAMTIDLRGSARTAFMHVPSGAPLQSYGPARLLPVEGAYPIQMQGLISMEGGITDLSAGQSNTFSVVFYWHGPGADGAAHDYSLAFRQRNNSGVRATADSTGSHWIVATLPEALHSGRVSVSTGGKNGGWTDLADYSLPFTFAASRQVPNLRGGRGK